MTEFNENIHLKEIAEEVDKIVAKGDPQTEVAVETTTLQADDTPTSDALAALEVIDYKFV